MKKLLLEDGKILTFNDDDTFRMQNPTPTGDETNYDKTGTFVVESENDASYNLILNFIHQWEEGVYKPYKNKLDVKIQIFKNENKIKLLRWRLNNEDSNASEGQMFSYKTI